MTDARRWYVAWHPDRPYGIIRAKAPAGVAEWRAREWRVFPGPPVIVDVTHALGAVLAQLPPDPAPPMRRQSPVAATLVISAEGPDVRLRSAELTVVAPADEVHADIGQSLVEIVGDMYAGSRRVVSLQRRLNMIPLQGVGFRAAAPFSAGARLARVATGHDGADGTPKDRPFPIGHIGERRSFPCQTGPAHVVCVEDADPALLWGLSHAQGPAMDWPPLWAAEEATEAGQVVPVRQGVCCTR